MDIAVVKSADTSLDKKPLRRRLFPASPSFQAGRGEEGGYFFRKDEVAGSNPARMLRHPVAQRLERVRTAFACSRPARILRSNPCATSALL